MDNPTQMSEAPSLEDGRVTPDPHFAQDVLDILVAATGRDEVRSNLDLQLYQSQLIDSLQTVELIVAFEARFGLEISLADFEREKWATPRKIISDLDLRKH